MVHENRFIFLKNFLKFASLDTCYAVYRIISMKLNSIKNGNFISNKNISRKSSKYLAKKSAQLSKLHIKCPEEQFVRLFPKKNIFFGTSTELFFGLWRFFCRQNFQNLILCVRRNTLKKKFLLEEKYSFISIFGVRAKLFGRLARNFWQNCRSSFLRIKRIFLVKFFQKQSNF